MAITAPSTAPADSNGPSLPENRVAIYSGASPNVKASRVSEGESVGSSTGEAPGDASPPAGDGPAPAEAANGARARLGTGSSEHGRSVAMKLRSLSSVGSDAGQGGVGSENQMVSPLGCGGEAGALGEGYGSGSTGSPGGAASVVSASASAPQRHVFYVPSGLCLLSTRSESGAMRRALASFWRAHELESARGSGAVGSEGDGSNATGSRASGCWSVTAGAGGGLVEPGACGGGDQLEDIFAYESDEASLAEEIPWWGLSGQEVASMLAPHLTGESARGEAGATAEASAVSGGEGGADKAEHDEPASMAFASVSAPALAAGGRHGRAFASPSRDGPGGWGFDFDASVVLRCLNPRHLCMIVMALLCERKVVMVSSRLSLLSMAGEVFR